MALSVSGRNDAANGIAGGITYMSLHTADPGANGINEVLGGAPAYIRKAVTWGAAANGQVGITNQPVFDVPGQTTIGYFGLWTAATNGQFKGGGALSATETFGAQGTYTVTSATVTVN